jgi:hypothetical protein
MAEDNDWIIATGDVNKGFTFYGPFDHAGAAEAWANKQPFAPYWTLVPLLRPAMQ